MRRARVALSAALFLPTLAGAQDVLVRDAGPMRVASIVRNVIAQPHALRAGDGTLVLRRDTTVTTSLLVLGRPTYVASRVQGDVVVVGADLFLRPGSEITGRAIAIGGTVSRTFLGRVGESVESYRDDNYEISRAGSNYQLDYRAAKRPDAPSMFQLAGLQGLLMPSYDRVDGLSLPIGALVTLGDRAMEIQPTLTYRSRLGKVDPGVELRVAPERAVRLEANVGRSTRTNEQWIYSDLINSALSLGLGNDTRNYFRADGGTARLIGRVETPTFTLEPFVGGRYEKVSPITATGDVFAFFGRDSTEHIRRPNPLVEPGTIGSGLLGAALTYRAGVVRASLSAEGEQSFRTPSGTSSFRQLTLDGLIEFPTFGAQRLAIRAHTLSSFGDSVPRARYSYIGQGRTLPLLERLEFGGDQLLFVESKYAIPITGLVLPVVGSPTIFLRHLMGAAGVGSLPKLEQEVGAGIGISLLRVDVTIDAAGKRSAEFGIGLSMSN